MARRDTIHNAVKQALVNDGWTITHDPFTIRRGKVRLQIDLGAERTLAAERDGQKIAVEIKSFIGKSLLKQLQEAVGQYVIYLGYLQIVAPERQLYLAVADTVYEAFTRLDDITAILRQNQIHLLLVNLEREEVTQWIN